MLCTPLAENPVAWDRPSDLPASLPLRGREEEIWRIEQYILATAETRQASMLVVASAEGTGISRLVAESASLAVQGGFSVVGLSPDAFPAEGSRTDHPHVVSLGSLAAQIEPQVIGHLRHGPVLVTLDDAHRTSPPVLGAVSTVMAKLKHLPVCWLLTLHDEHSATVASAVLQDMARTLPCDWIGPLPPLPDDAALGMAADLLRAEPDADVAALVGSAGGTPRGVGNLVVGLLRDNHVQVVDGVARLTAGRWSAVSPAPCRSSRPSSCPGRSGG